MPQLIVNGLVTGTLTALLATAFVVLYRGSRFFVFTFGTAYLFGAYGMLLCRNVVPLVVAAFAGIVVAAAINVLLEMFIYRPIRRNRDNAPVLMLASIGAYTVLQNVVSMTFGDATRSVHPWDVREGFLICGARMTDAQVLIACVSVTVIASVGLVLAFSSFGRTLRAVADDAWLARAAGVTVETTRAIAAGLAGVMAGIAGVVTSLDTDMTPTIGFHALLLAIVAAIVGGATSYGGAVAGGMFVGLTLHVSVWKLPTAWQDAILFAVLLAFLLLRPRGFLGKSVRTATV